MKITESQLRRIIREEVNENMSLNEMDPATAAAFGAVGAKMAGVDIAMMAPAVIVSALTAAGLSKDWIDGVIEKAKAAAGRQRLPDNS